MKLKVKEKKRLEYRHVVTYNGVDYIREEVIIPHCYAWQSEPDVILDLHTIKWCYEKNNGEEIVEYYSIDRGWSSKGHLAKNNSTPEIEIVFKETFGKDLIYF
jgi:hypothetical protein